MFSNVRAVQVLARQTGGRLLKSHTPSETERLEPEQAGSSSLPSELGQAGSSEDSHAEACERALISTRFRFGPGRRLCRTVEECAAELD